MSIYVSLNLIYKVEICNIVVEYHGPYCINALNWFQGLLKVADQKSTFCKTNLITASCQKTESEIDNLKLWPMADILCNPLICWLEYIQSL